MRRLARFVLLLGMGCAQASDPANDPKIAEHLRSTAPTPAFPSTAKLLERGGSAEVRYLGFDAKPAGPAKPGDVVELTHYFSVVQPFRQDYQVFVHGETAGGQRLLVGDHAPVFGRAPTNRWKAGQIWADPHRIQIPKDAVGSDVHLWVGLFAGKARATAQADPGQTDGQDRIRAGKLPLDAAAIEDGLPSVLLAWARGPITADGVLDEPAWNDAPVLTLSDTMGRDKKTEYPTKLRLLYDADNLYAAFESVDPDISCPFDKRDDPIYDHETVELFLMPHVQAPALGPYVELQASPKGIIFDASFTGRRQGMDKGFNAEQTIGTKLDGTLNQHDDEDKGWVSEWVVPWKSLRFVQGPPAPGDEWRMNAFRIENKGEYTAWSPPRVGDFHNVERFGRMRFGPKQEGQNQP